MFISPKKFEYSFSIKKLCVIIIIYVIVSIELPITRVGGIVPRTLLIKQPSNSMPSSLFIIVFL